MYMCVCMYVHTNAKEEKQNTIPVEGCRFCVEVSLTINDLCLPKTLCVLVLINVFLCYSWSFIQLGFFGVFFFFLIVTSVYNWDFLC